jgi:hypothetical protein
MGYGALAGIIAVAISTFLEYQNRTDPYARADAFTGADGIKLQSYFERELTEVRTEIAQIRSAVEACRNTQIENSRWRGGIDARIDECQRLLRRSK